MNSEPAFVGAPLKTPKTAEIAAEAMLQRIQRLNMLSEEKDRINPEESLSLATVAKNLAEAAGDQPGIIKSLLQIGRSHWLQGNLKNAMTTLLQALEKARQHNEHWLEVDTLNALGNVTLYMHNYPHTLGYYGQALKRADATGYEELAAGILNNFGEVYKNLKDYSTALMYYHESLSRYEANDWQYEGSIPMVNIGIVCCELGDFQQALAYADKSMAAHKEARYVVGEGYSRHLYGRIAHRQGRLEEAVQEYKGCLELLPETSDINLRIDLCIDLYEALRDLGELEQALGFMMEGLAVAQNLETDSVVLRFYSMIATHHQQQGNQSMSADYYKHYHDRHSRMIEIERQNQLQGIAFQMEADEYLEKHRAYEVLTDRLKEQAVVLEEKTKALARSKERVQVISEIGQKITATLNISHVFQQIYQHTNTLMRADVLGIGVFQPEKEALEYPCYIEGGEQVPVFSIPLTSQSSWAAWCFKNQQEVFVNDAERDFRHYIVSNQNSIGELMHSLLFCPLTVNDVPVGVITVQSRDKHVYEAHHLDTLRILASYAAIAINNARQSEELEKLNEQLKNLSEVDGLTSVANRRKFDQFFGEEWERSLRDASPLSLLFIDIDYFKGYNDDYGHHAGDQVLREVASILKNSLRRSSDFIARYGGDEFVVLLHNTGEKGAIQLAEGMVRAVASRNMALGYGGINAHVTITIGASTLTPHTGIARDELLQKADEALYQAKKNGRNGMVHL